MTTIARKLLERIKPSYWELRSFTKKRTVLHEAGPFPLTIYRRFLELISKSPYDCFSDFSIDNHSGMRRRWYVRHDIDMPLCIQRCACLLDIELALGVRSACFIRIDSPAYRVSDTVHIANEYRPRGVVFGLHTECYLFDNWRARLEFEIRRFEEELGFHPCTLNAHGGFPHRQTQRRAFYSAMTRQQLYKFGFQFSDLHFGLRAYDSIVEDCHASGPSSGPEDYRPERRRLLSDFAVLPPRRNGSVALVLTHPGYWFENGSRAVMA